MRTLLLGSAARRALLPLRDELPSITPIRVTLATCALLLPRDGD